MLVVGITENANSVYSDLDIDLSSDAPKKIVALLAKATGCKQGIISMLVIENDEVVEKFEDGTDYDLDEEAASDDEDYDDEDGDLEVGDSEDFEIVDE